MAVTQALATALPLPGPFDVPSYVRDAKVARRECAKSRDDRAKSLLAAIRAGATKMVKRRLDRMAETGLWLTLMPETLNGTDLSPDEFRDSLRIRYGLVPKNLPPVCDGAGCKASFTVNHAMTCKKGGHVVQRHDGLKQVWHRLCGESMKPSAVRDEPLIHTGRADTTPGAAAGAVLPDLRGDVAVLSFWQAGTECIFDVRVTDTECPSYATTATEGHAMKVLAVQEKKKKLKYNQACLDRRRHFTPLVFSVDGVEGKEVKAAIKCLASKLSNKQKRTMSQVVAYVRSQLSISLVRSVSQCLRASRDPLPKWSSPAWESAELGLSVYK